MNNNRLINIIVEYFNTFFKNDYIVFFNGNKEVFYLSARGGYVGYFIDKEGWTLIDEDDIITVTTSATKLTILTNSHKEYCFIARQKTNEEKVNELVEAITARLAGREELNMIKEYLDELKKVNKVHGRINQRVNDIETVKLNPNVTISPKNAI